MIGSFDNGKRLDVEFGAFKGTAGVVRRADRVTLSFPGRERDFEVGMIGTIAGAAFRVVSVARSAIMQRLVIIEAEEL